MIRRLIATAATLAAIVTAGVVTQAPQAAYADPSPGCGTYTATMTPAPGMRVGLRPPYDNPYRGTGTVVSVDDAELITVNRDVAEDLVTRHEYVRYCDTQEAAEASEWGNWAAWPIVG